MMPHIIFLLLIASSPFYALGDETASWGSISSGPSESECRPYIEKALQGATIPDSPNTPDDADDVGETYVEGDQLTQSEVSESESSETPSDSEEQINELENNDKSQSTEAAESETKEESIEDVTASENEEELSGEVLKEFENIEESSTEPENISEEVPPEISNENIVNITDETLTKEDEVQSEVPSIEEIGIDESVEYIKSGSEETENIHEEVSEEEIGEGKLGSAEEGPTSEEEIPALGEGLTPEESGDNGDSQDIPEETPIEAQESYEEELLQHDEPLIDEHASMESTEEESTAEAVDTAELTEENITEEKLDSIGEDSISDSIQTPDTLEKQNTEEPAESQISEASSVIEESTEVTEEKDSTIIAETNSIDAELQELSDNSEEGEQGSRIDLEEPATESTENEAEKQSRNEETSKESEVELTPEEDESVAKNTETSSEIVSEIIAPKEGEFDGEHEQLEDVSKLSELSGEISSETEIPEPEGSGADGSEAQSASTEAEDIVGSESGNTISEGQEATEQPTPEEELSMDVEVPENLRVRDHMAQILQLNAENEEQESLLSKTVEHTLRELKKLYDVAIKPLEMLYRYRDLSNRHFGDPEIFSKPLILFMGPWSGGKSTIINYLLENEYKKTALRTGAEPSPAYFNIVMWGEREEILDGTQLAADWTFSGLQKFGQGLLDRLRGLKLKHPLLEKVNIVEIPGILEIRKQVERLFPFNDACQWFIDRADIIFLVYDPSKLDVGPETEAILDQLKGREMQTRIILNKADQVKPEELMRVQGTLIWNISPLMSSTEPPVMYSTSLWSIPYEIGAPTRLLYAQEKAFLKDLRDAIDKRVENKIASARRFAVRVRNHAKMVDCYLTTYYNHKSFFGNKKKISDDIIEHPQNYHIYEGLSTLTNISRYDLPDPDVYRDFFRLNPVYEFQQLSSTCTYFRGCPINRLDVAIAYDLPELIGKYKKNVENVLSSLKK